jgi:hypothetical protein
MDIKRKTCDIRTCEKHLYLYISSTNIDALVPSLYQCAKTRSIEVFFTAVSDTSAPPSQPLRLQRSFATFLDQVVNRFRRKTLPTSNNKYFFMSILCIESFRPQKRTSERYCSVLNSSSTVAILTTETSL